MNDTQRITELADLAEDWRGRYVEKRTDAEAWEAAHDVASAEAEEEKARAEAAEYALHQARAQVEQAERERDEARADLANVRDTLAVYERGGRTLGEMVERRDRRLSDLEAIIRRVDALAVECASQHGQCWNSVFAQRLRTALDDREPQ